VSDPEPRISEGRRPTFGEAFRFWLKLGFISFGGPAGQIAIMHRELVEERQWIDEPRFLHALNFCMLLPGPEATQLAIYIGWVLHRVWGGIVAGVLFVLPSAVLLWALSWGYMVWGRVPAVTALFDGLKPAVLAIVAVAVVRIGKRVLKNPVMWVIAAMAFIAIYFARTPFPLIIVSAALIGLLGERFHPCGFRVLKSGDGAATAEQPPATTRSRAFSVLTVGLALWWIPLIVARFWLGPEHAISRQGIFFSQAAMVTFGGAYAVLPYVAQQAVERFAWIAPGQMLDGLALAETTPGPLIMVLQFVGFVGAWQHPGSLSPFAAGTLGAAVTTWATFAPCFLWIFLGAPNIERMRGNARMAAALSAVTAAVVGVILNLAVSFGRPLLFPSISEPNWFGIAIASVAAMGMLRWKWGIIPVVAGAAAAGFLWSLR
jgi:chromate transporter